MTKSIVSILEVGENTGFSAVEVFREKTERKEYQFFPGEPTFPGHHAVDTDKVTVRAFWDSGDPVGFILSRPSVQAVKSAFSHIYSTQMPNVRPNFHHLLPAVVTKGGGSIFDDGFSGVGLQNFNEMIDRIQEYMVSPLFPGLRITRALLTKVLKKVYLVNSRQLNVKYKKTLFNLQLSFTLGQNCIDISEHRVFLGQIDVNKMVSRGYNLLLSLTENRIGDRSSMFLVLSPEASVMILREFSPYFKVDGDREIMNMHYPAILNVIDDPLMNGMPGTVPFDDEGVEGEERYLIRKGVFSQHIADIAAGFEYKTVSTGNGFRNDRSPFPAMRFSNLYIKPTVMPLKHLLNTAGRGVVISLLKLKAIEKERYLFSAYGYRFQDNDLLEPVHFYIRTTARSYFLNILKISKEVKFFHSGFNIGSPYILVEGRGKGDYIYEI